MNEADNPQAIRVLEWTDVQLFSITLPNWGCHWHGRGPAKVVQAPCSPSLPMSWSLLIPIDGGHRVGRASRGFLLYKLTLYKVSPKVI